MGLTRNVQPIPPVATWRGGKSNLAKRLVERIEAIAHETYAEPFLGTGRIFLRRHRAPKAEVVNDHDLDVATLFRVVQQQYVPFIDMMCVRLTTQGAFQRLVATDPLALTDLERAARLLYLQRTTLGGKAAAHSFGVDTDRPVRFRATRLGATLEDLHRRLAGVVIECMPWDEFIHRYDRPGTLFYIGPPDGGCEQNYDKPPFSRDQFAALAGQLRSIRGRFILSINDQPEIRRLFRWAGIEKVETTCIVGGEGEAQKMAQLIISGGAASYS